VKLTSYTLFTRFRAVSPAFSRSVFELLLWKRELPAVAKTLP
jgi:hypothetical protein